MKIYSSVAQLILVLESSMDSFARIHELLISHFRVRLVPFGGSIVDACCIEFPSLILINTVRAENDGITALLELKKNPVTRSIPVVVMMSEIDVEIAYTLHEIGVVDYITRPLCPPTLLSRIRAHVATNAMENAQRISQDLFEYQASKHKQQMTAVQEIALLTVATLAEARDFQTVNHLKRTQHFVYALGRQLMSHPKFCDYLNVERLNIISKSAPLHDIGKIGIPNKILLKHGCFGPTESAMMEEHTTLGRDAIQNAQDILGDRSEFFEIAKDIAYSHHEKWDGSGYPQGLFGDAIPISARLMALADVYNEVIGCRFVHKECVSHDQAVSIIVGCREQCLDPDVVDAFLMLGDVFQGIATQFVDADEDLLEQ